MIVLLRASVQRLEQQAALLNYTMRLDEMTITLEAKKGYEAVDALGVKAIIKPFEINSGSFDSITSYRPYESIFGPYAGKLDRTLLI